MKNGLVILFCCSLLGACSKADLSSQAQPALANYAANLYAMYSASVTDAQTFSTSVEAFLTTPTEANLTATRSAWIASRANYMLTEGGRFYDGPIDIDPPNHEASVNSWPLDESYIDYSIDPTTGAIDDTVGIVNNPSMLPTIDADGLDMLNAQGGDENISDGYHAVEFLLWGKALMPVGPGTRPATDYMTGGPRPNVDRRAAFLRAATAGIISHLTAVRDAWALNADYRTSFEKGGGASVALALTGMGRFSKGELSGQRLNTAYASKMRHDQHDCFSSLTLVDYTRDAQGILGLFAGDYGTTNGPGFDDLLKEHDAALAAQVSTTLQASIDDVKAIPAPFEAAILGDDSSPGRTAIRAAVASLRAQGDLFGTAASALGLSIVVPDEN